MSLVDDIVRTLQDSRRDADSGFHNLFVTVTDIAAKHDIELKLPRKTGRQIHRENYPSNDPEEYYRQSVYIPYIDNMLTQLNERFEVHNRICLRLQGILPRFIDTTSFDDLKEPLQMYKADLGETSVIRGETERWKSKWAAFPMADRPLSATETLQQCNKLLFPQIHILLRLFVTLPLTSATAERSFSTMRRLKSYLRSTMGASRLNGLAQMSINRDLPIDPEDVLDELAKNKRRLNFVL